MGEGTKRAFQLIGSVAKKAVEIPVKGAVAIARAFAGGDDDRDNGRGGRQRPADSSDRASSSRSSSSTKGTSRGASARSSRSGSRSPRSKSTTSSSSSETSTESTSEDAETDAELTDIWGVGDSRADDLVDAGFESVRDVAEASKDDLSEISGIGGSTAQKMIDSAEELLAD